MSGGSAISTTGSQNEPFALAGEGILLSTPLNSDVDALAATCQDPEIQKWTTVPKPYGPADAQYFVDEVAPKTWADGGGQWAIRATVAGETELVGMVGLTPGKEKNAEIGYWMAPHARNRGILTKAVNLVCDAAFERMGFECLIWRAKVGNWPSWRVAWKLGFRRGGTLRGQGISDGKRCDEWIATLLSGDARKPAAPWDGPTLGDGVPESPSSRDPEALVKQFHRVYRMPINYGDADINYERVHMRMSLILEEVTELVTAVYGKKAGEALAQAAAKRIELDERERDVIETADALADLTYVIYGMALESGISLPAVLAEVQASNMSKLDENGEPIYREDGKVLKGKNFFPPNIARALRNHITD